MSQDGTSSGPHREESGGVVREPADGTVTCAGIKIRTSDYQAILELFDFYVQEEERQEALRQGRLAARQAKRIAAVQKARNKKARGRS